MGLNLLFNFFQSLFSIISQKPLGIKPFLNLFLNLLISFLKGFQRVVQGKINLFSRCFFKKRHSFGRLWGDVGNAS